MHYGVTFKLEIYDFENEKSDFIVSRPSDYLQMQIWGDKATKNLPSSAGELYGNYAVLYFALKRLGRLSEYGLEDDKLTVGDLNKLAERVSLYVSSVSDSDLPTKA